jgi:hypothetical protein
MVAGESSPASSGSAAAVARSMYASIILLAGGC